MKNTVNIFYSISLVMTSVFINTAAHAAIFKCVNKQGATYYNDKPCPVSNKETLMRAAKDPKGGYIPPKFVAEQQKVRKPGVLVGVSSKRNSGQNKNDSDSDSQVLAKNANQNANQSNSRGQSQASNSTKNSNAPSRTNAVNPKDLKNQVNKEDINTKTAVYRIEDY